MSGILGTALSGLMAFQRSLDTISNNIANVNTEGYSRQRVELSASTSSFEEGNYYGHGVNATAVTRNYDQFVNNQLNSSSSAFGESDTLSTLAARVDNVVASEATSLSPALQSFFSSVNGVANEPTSLPARQVMTSEADSLASQFNNLSSQFESLRSQANSQMQSTVDDINLDAESLAALNGKIALESARFGGRQMPNDLLDQRDALITKLSQKVSISTLPQDDGTVNVFIGKGAIAGVGDCDSQTVGHRFANHAGPQRSFAG